MKKAALYNFHLPLPEDTYQELRTKAERARQPITVLARRVIDRRAEAIAAYAREVAGTEQDLDPAFEAAAIDHWLDHEGRSDAEARGQGPEATALLPPPPPKRKLPIEP